MSLDIGAYCSADEAAIVDLSVHAWAPVFDQLRGTVPAFVYAAFYPQGWQERQTSDIRAFLLSEPDSVFTCKASGVVVGWVGIRLHPTDSMGEIYILAVDPAWQRKGVGSALMDHAVNQMRRAGMKIAMVETGDDPGHAPSRATYEQAGFERWPVARYFRDIATERTTS